MGCISPEKRAKLAKGGVVKKRRDKDTFTEYAEGGTVGKREYVGTGYTEKEEKDIAEIANIFKKNGIPAGFRTKRERSWDDLPNDRMQDLEEEAYRRVTPKREQRLKKGGKVRKRS